MDILVFTGGFMGCGSYSIQWVVAAPSLVKKGTWKACKKNKDSQIRIRTHFFLYAKFESGLLFGGSDPDPDNLNRESASSGLKHDSLAENAKLKQIKHSFIKHYTARF